jgi:hypothetical protein
MSNFIIILIFLINYSNFISDYGIIYFNFIGKKAYFYAKFLALSLSVC